MPVATAPIWPLAWEPPYAAGAAQRKSKKQKKKKRRSEGRHNMILIEIKRILKKYEQLYAEKVDNLKKIEKS